MSSMKAIAYCHRRKGAHKLVELAVSDGRPVIRYAAAVAGLSVRRGKNRGHFNMGQHWTTMPLDSDDMLAGTGVYCEACGSEYWVSSLQSLASQAKKSGKPVVLKPLTSAEMPVVLPPS